MACDNDDPVSCYKAFYVLSFRSFSWEMGVHTYEDVRTSISLADFYPNFMLPFRERKILSS